jgi:hypothetical protein
MKDRFFVQKFLFSICSSCSHLLSKIMITIFFQQMHSLFLPFHTSCVHNR